MTRTIDSGNITASQDEVIRPVMLVRLDFSGGIVAINESAVNFDYDGDTYLGVGLLGGVSPIEEGSEAKPYAISLTLSGIPTETISIALGQQYQGRDAKIYMALIDEDHQIIGVPTMLFNGRIDTMDIEVGELANITVTVQSRMVDWDRPRVRRYNNEDQIVRYPNDKGMEYVPQMVERSLIWGRS